MWKLIRKTANEGIKNEKTPNAGAGRFSWSVGLGHLLKSITNSSITAL